MDDALYTELKANTALTALIGGAFAPRIFALQAPDKSPLPYLVFHLISGSIPSKTPRADADYLYQIDVWATSASEANSIQIVIANAIDGAGLTVTGWDNYHTKLRSIITDVENEGAKQFYRCGGDYQFLWVKA